MPLIIDAYNVLHTTGVLPPELAGGDLDDLIGLLGRSRHADDRVTLVCDGVPPVLPVQAVASAGRSSACKPPSNLIVRYAGPGRSADDLIIELVGLSTAPRRLTVVSSDHQILRAAKKRRCTILSSAELLQQLADDAELPRSGSRTFPKPAGMSDRQVAKWMDIFGVSNDMQTEDAPKTPERSPEATLGQSSNRAQAGPPQAFSAEDLSAKPTPSSRDSSQSDQAPEDASGPVLPLALIEQAERLVRDAQPAAEPPSQQPSPPASPSASAPKAQTVPEPPPPDPLHDITDQVIAAIDMDRLLPPDGRTRRLDRHEDRPRA